jgi:hypothetical protein
MSDVKPIFSYGDVISHGDNGYSFSEYFPLHVKVEDQRGWLEKSIFLETLNPSPDGLDDPGIVWVSLDRRWFVIFEEYPSFVCYTLYTRVRTNLPRFDHDSFQCEFDTLEEAIAFAMEPMDGR